MGRGRSALRFLLRLVGLTLACFATVRLGHALTTSHGTVSFLWISTGLAMGAFASWGLGLWPALVIGAAWSNLTFGMPLLVAGGLPLGNTLGAVFGAYLLRRWQLTGEPRRPRDGVLVMVVSAVASLIAALLIATVLAAAGLASGKDFMAAAILRWLGHFVGIILTTPLVLAWLGAPARPNGPARTRETILLLAVVTAVSLLVFRTDAFWAGLGMGHLSPTLFVVPALVWAALRLPPRESLLALALMASLAVWFTAAGYGPFTHDPFVDDLLELQLMLAVVGGTLLILIGAVAERDRVAAELVLAKQQADEANLAKSRFVAAIRHDLGQPLQATELFLAALRNRTSGNRELIDLAMGSLQAMAAALAALKDITAVECGLVQPAISAFPIAELLGQVAEECRIQASERQLRVLCVPGSAWVESDRQLLGRVLRNILANAIRYTHQGGIVLGCRTDPRGVRIEVWDTGPGIPVEEQEAIFEAFHRGKSAPRTAMGENDSGLGLGLATVRQLASLLGLKVTVRSRVGKGSVFAVMVPRAALPSDRRSAA